MSRRMKLPTKELGEVQLLAVWEKGGIWEEEWEPLRGTPIGSLFSSVPQEVLDNALAGWTRPLAIQLGLPPEGALAKLPVSARVCAKKRGCVFYDVKACFPTTKKTMPWCYEPGGIADENQRLAAAKAVEMWREGVYVLVVKEDHA